MIAVVPTRDEADTIAQTVTDLRLLGQRPVIVDSSESFSTTAVARAAGAKVIECRDDGLGPAYLAAWLHIDGDQAVMHADAGHSHPYSSLKRVLDAVGTADVVVGSRFCPGAHYEGNPRRRRMSRWAAFACNLASHRTISDWTSGLRVYSPRARDLLAGHEFQTKGHAWQIEALDVCARAGLTIREVPITYVAGRSHLTRARVREAARYWFRMVRS